MSGPNDPYDPKQVTVLAPEGLAQAVEDAEKAFAEAADLEELAAAKPAHLGDRSPLLSARREIGALPPQARAEAGKRLNSSRTAVQAAFDQRRAALQIERDSRTLREEAVDVTLPWDRVPVGARHPITALCERIADMFVAMGYEVAEGPELEAAWFNFDALNFPQGPPGAHHAGQLLRRSRGVWHGPAHAHLPGSDTGPAGAGAAGVRGVPGAHVP